MGHLIVDESNGIETLKYFQYINVYIKSFNNLLSSRILSVGKLFLEQEVHFSPMGMHNKGPKIGSITPPHQDNFYSNNFDLIEPSGGDFLSNIFYFKKF